MPLKTVTPETLREAAALLRAGRLVAFPTETVYGLGANALDGKVVAGIFVAKGRPSFNPVIVHVETLAQGEQYGVFDALSRAVAASFWPGPLTLIVPRRADCAASELCSAGLPTIALRAPAHPAAQALLKESGVPIAAPSANKSGTISPTTPQLVEKSLGAAVDMILAAGPCAVGLESTVLDLSGDEPAILRPGAVTAEDIERQCGLKVGYDLDPREKPKSPGQLLRHYAPSIPLRLNAVEVEPGEALLAFGSLKFMGVKGGGFAKDLPAHALRNLSPEGDLHEAAANLFRMLHELDIAPHTRIAAMNIPDQGLGIAINDRLKRAARG